MNQIEMTRFNDLNLQGFMNGKAKRTTAAQRKAEADRAAEVAARQRAAFDAANDAMFAD